MKLHTKNKGKVHPSPLSPSTTAATTEDPSSALKLLPAAIFALISVLSQEDQEVLAYMITRSLETTANPSHLLLDDNNRPRRQRRAKQGLAAAPPHTPPVFQCGCFDCYTSYWFRWDSSLNRELIHQAIEAFEDHLTIGESEQSRKRGGRGRRKSEKKLVPLTTPEISLDEIGVVSPILAPDLPENVDFPVVDEELVAAPAEVEAVDAAEEVEEEEAVVVVVTGGDHKGLARKVLPDVIGLLNSRFWSLWSPNA